MTIANGLLASEGIVMAADTQETAGPWKRSKGKLSIAGRRLESTESGHGTCLISGSSPARRASSRGTARASSYCYCRGSPTTPGSQG